MNDGQFKFDVDAPVRCITDDTILRSLREFVEQHEPDQLTTLKYDAWDARVCTAQTISKRFKQSGGWRAALEKVGITTGVRSREYSAKARKLVWNDRQIGCGSLTPWSIGV